jgi:hypothetical protein
LSLWAEQAAVRLLAGDTVDLYNARAKTGREGDTELHLGRGSAVIIEHPEGEEITFEGTVLVTPAGTFIDDGTTRYLLNADLLHGQEVRVTGPLSRNRITPHQVEPAVPDADALAARLLALKREARVLTGGQTRDAIAYYPAGHNTFTPHGRVNIFRCRGDALRRPVR